MNVFEQKCLYYETKNEKEEIILVYNTREPMYDSKRFSKVIPCKYDVQVIVNNGTILQEQTLEDEGERRFQIEHPQTVKFCFRVSQTLDNYKDTMKQLKRAGKKVDIKLTNQQTIDQESEQAKADERISTAVRLVSKSRAVRSLQNGRKNVRNRIEKRLYRTSGHYITVTVLEIIAYLTVNIISLHIIKTYIRRHKL